MKKKNDKRARVASAKRSMKRHKRDTKTKETAHIRRENFIKDKKNKETKAKEEMDKIMASRYAQSSFDPNKNKNFIQ